MSDENLDKALELAKTVQRVLHALKPLKPVARARVLAAACVQLDLYDLARQFIAAAEREALEDPPPIENTP